MSHSPNIPVRVWVWCLVTSEELVKRKTFPEGCQHHLVLSMAQSPFPVCLPHTQPRSSEDKHLSCPQLRALAPESFLWSLHPEMNERPQPKKAQPRQQACSMRKTREPRQALW